MMRTIALACLPSFPPSFSPLLRSFRFSFHDALLLRSSLTLLFSHHLPVSTIRSFPPSFSHLSGLLLFAPSTLRVPSFLCHLLLLPFAPSPVPLSFAFSLLFSFFSILTRPPLTMATFINTHDLASWQ